MRHNKLIPKSIIDKNGKQTTVHVLPNGSSRSRTERVQVSRAEKTHQLVIPPSPQALANADPNSIYAIKRWDKKPLQHTFVYSATGGRFVLAPEGYSGAYCDECGSFFKDDEINDVSVRCNICLRHSRGGRIITGVRYSDVPLFDDDTARDTDWYHITTRDTWGDDIRSESSPHQPFIHVGSLEAAQRRMRDLIAQHHVNGETTPIPKFYGYRVQISADAPLSPHVLPDFDNAAPSSAHQALKRMKQYPDDYEEFYGSYELYGATRYVNEYESHGSISLIVNPEAIEVLERFEM